VGLLLERVLYGLVPILLLSLLMLLSLPRSICQLSLIVVAVMRVERRVRGLDVGMDEFRSRSRSRHN